MKCVCAKIVAPRTFEFVQEELPPLGPHGILVRMDSVGLCRSDLPRYTGTATIAVSPEGYRESRPMEFPGMVGHEPVGTVADIGVEVRRFRVGDRITGHMPTCFRTHLVIDEYSMVFEIPKNLRTDHRYCVAEPLGCVVNILDTIVEENPGYVAVVGCGPLGLLTISGLRGYGVDRIAAVDLEESRLETARSYGATTALCPAKEDVRKAAHRMTKGHFFDTVVEITGSIRGLETACEIIKFAHEDGLQDTNYHGRGRVLACSVYGGNEVFPFGLAHDMMLRTPVIHAVHPSAARDVLENDRRGVDMYQTGLLPLEKMITHTCRFEHLATGFGWLEQPPAGYLKGLVLFDWEDGEKMEVRM